MWYREAVERWYRVTGNPLYALEAIAICLNSGSPVPEWCLLYLKQTSIPLLEPIAPYLGNGIPEWCLPYLKQVTSKITDLQYAVARGEINPAVASRQTLGLVQGRKNEFARVLDHIEAMKAGLIVINAARRGKPDDAEKTLMARRNIGEDRAARIKRFGLRLIGW